MNILVIDDETVIREGIERTLRNRFPEHAVYLASRPEEAVTLLRKHPIHIVLTDILMPEMSGLDLMKIARPRHPNVKWVVISAHSEFAYAQEAVRLGAKDYLIKPIGKDAIADMITKLSAEIEREAEVTEELELLRENRKLLREAAFQRWALGLDMGRIDMRPFMENYPSFHLVLVKMQGDTVKQLEHFIIENVLSELIEKYGDGFVLNYDSKSLLGLARPRSDASFAELLEQLRGHLLRCLRVPFQILHSVRIDDYNDVPERMEELRQASDTQTYEHYAGGGDEAVEVALQYMNAHYREELTLEKLASIVYLHPVYFSQLFKQKTGSGFKEYIIQLRLEQSKRLLLNPRLKLADVAERIGYQDMRHFTQLFRKKFGMTPTEYRQTYQVGVAE
ncbi:response regulator [Paenibacillus sp. TRM 82003]|nr:response regulator [Paenibacillus sp. TRM 82003]